MALGFTSAYGVTPQAVYLSISCQDQEQVHLLTGVITAGFMGPLSVFGEMRFCTFHKSKISSVELRCKAKVQGSLCIMILCLATETERHVYIKGMV